MYFEAGFQMFEAEQIIKLYKCLAGGHLDIHFKLMNKSPVSGPSCSKTVKHKFQTYKNIEYKKTKIQIHKYKCLAPWYPF